MFGEGMLCPYLSTRVLEMTRRRPVAIARREEGHVHTDLRGRHFGYNETNRIAESYDYTTFTVYL